MVGPILIIGLMLMCCGGVACLSLYAELHK